MINQVVLIGRISNELDLKYTPNSGNAVCEFNLAVNRPPKKDKEKETDFIKCVVWGKQAENLVNYQQIGNLIAVTGRYQVDKYINDKEETRYKHYVLIGTIQFLENKKEQLNNNQSESKPITTNEDPFQQMHDQIEQENDIDNDLLPF